MATVDVVLVGCGCPKRGMGWYHLTQLLEMPNVVMKAVVEPFYLGPGGSAPGAKEFMEMKTEYEAKGVAFYSSNGSMPPCMPQGLPAPPAQCKLLVNELG